MRILVIDELDQGPFDSLSLLGAEVIYRPDLVSSELRQALQDVDILVVRSTPVRAEHLAESRRLSLIVVAGVEVTPMVDLVAASERGIHVANCPGKNAAAVAELTMGLVVALDRRLVDATLALRSGRWDPAPLLLAPGLEGRRMGIAGLGAVGMRVLDCARAFGMEPHVWSRKLTPARASRMGVGYCSSLTELAAKSDVLTVHLAIRPETRHCIDKSVLEALPDGAIFVHASHPDLLDYDALRTVIDRKRLRVGLDVYPNEPSAPTDGFAEPSFKAGLVYGTPHIGGSTLRAELAVAREASRIARAFLTEGEVPNVVNICRTTPARFALVLRMSDRVGALANALNVIKRHGINIEEITNSVFDGARAACTRLRLSARPSESCLQEIGAFEEVLHVTVVQLPHLA